MTIIVGVFTIVYFVILQKDVASLGLKNYQFTFLTEFIVISIHWIFNFFAALLGLITIMNKSSCTMNFFLATHTVNLMLLLAGSGLLVNYRVKNYQGSFTYLDIVLYVELLLLLLLVITYFSIFKLFKKLRSKFPFSYQTIDFCSYSFNYQKIWSNH